MSCKTADFVEFRAGATEPKHCVTESLAQHRRSEEEEEGGAQVGAEEISFGRTESETTPAFYAQDAALGWRLCHLGLEGTFSHKWANRRNVSPPPDAFQRKRMWPALFYGRGGSNWRNSPGNVSIHRQRGPSNYGGPLYTTHKRDQDAKQLRPMGGLCGLQRLRSDRSTTRPCPGIRFFCVCVSSSSVLLVL